MADAAKKVNVIVLEPLSAGLSSFINKATNNQDKYEVFTVQDPDEVSQLIRQFNPCILVSSLNTADNLTILSMALAPVRDVAKAGLIKAIISSQLNPNAAKYLEANYIQGVIQEPINERTLQFKLNLLVKSIESIIHKKVAAFEKKFEKDKAKELEKLKIGDLFRNDVKDSDTPNLKKVPELGIKDDFFLFGEGKSKIKNQKIFIEVEGPGPEAGEWREFHLDEEDGKARWRFVATEKKEEKEDEKNGWVFEGTKPKWNPRNETWDMQGDEIDLSLWKNGKKKATKIKSTAKNALTVAENSTTAQEAVARAKETRKKNKANQSTFGFKKNAEESEKNKNQQLIKGNKEKEEEAETEEEKIALGKKKKILLDRKIKGSGAQKNGESEAESENAEQETKTEEMPKENSKLKELRRKEREKNAARALANGNAENEDGSGDKEESNPLGTKTREKKRIPLWGEPKEESDENNSESKDGLKRKVKEKGSSISNATEGEAATEEEEEIKKKPPLVLKQKKTSFSKDDALAENQTEISEDEEAGKANLKLRIKKTDKSKEENSSVEDNADPEEEEKRTQFDIKEKNASSKAIKGDGTGGDLEDANIEELDERGFPVKKKKKKKDEGSAEYLEGNGVVEEEDGKLAEENKALEEELAALNKKKQSEYQSEFNPLDGKKEIRENTFSSQLTGEKDALKGITGHSQAEEEENEEDKKKKKLYIKEKGETASAPDLNTKYFYKSLAELGYENATWHKAGSYYVFLQPHFFYKGFEKLEDVFPLWLNPCEYPPEFLEESKQWRFIDFDAYAVFEEKDLPYEVYDFLIELVKSRRNAEFEENETTKKERNKEKIALDLKKNKQREETELLAETTANSIENTLKGNSSSVAPEEASTKLSANSDLDEMGNAKLKEIKQADSENSSQKDSLVQSDASSKSEKELKLRKKLGNFNEEENSNLSSDASNSANAEAKKKIEQVVNETSADNNEKENQGNQENKKSKFDILDNKKSELQEDAADLSLSEGSEADSNKKQYADGASEAEEADKLKIKEDALEAEAEAKKKKATLADLDLKNKRRLEESEAAAIEAKRIEAEAAEEEAKKKIFEEFENNSASAKKLMEQGVDESVDKELKKFLNELNNNTKKSSADMDLRKSEEEKNKKIEGEFKEKEENAEQDYELELNTKHIEFVAQFLLADAYIDQRPFEHYAQQILRLLEDIVPNAKISILGATESKSSAKILVTNHSLMQVGASINTSSKEHPALVSCSTQALLPWNRKKLGYLLVHGPEYEVTKRQRSALEVVADTLSKYWQGITKSEQEEAA